MRSLGLLFSVLVVAGVGVILVVSFPWRGHVARHGAGCRSRSPPPGPVAPGACPAGGLVGRQMASRW